MNDQQRQELNDTFAAWAKANGAIIDWANAANKAAKRIADMITEWELLEGNHPNPNPPDPTVYSQRDPRWANEKLGTSYVTVGSHGCLVTSIASCITDAGYTVTPSWLNQWLTIKAGYTGGNLFIFDAVDKLGVMKFYGLIECANVPAPVAQLDQLVAQKDFVVVKVDFDPKTITTEEHWARYVGDGRIIDPWYGDIAPIVPRYRGRDAAQAILRAAIYKRVSA